MEFNGNDYRKALYEDTRDRHNGEHANAIVVGGDPNTIAKAPFITITAQDYAFLFKALPDGTAGVSKEAVFESGKWGRDGALYVDGYTTIYGVKKGQDPAVVEQQTIAIQDKGSGMFFAAPGFTVSIVKSPTVRDKFLIAPPKVGPGNSPHWDAPVGTDGTLTTPVAGGPEYVELSPLLASTGVFIVKIGIDPNYATDLKKLQMVAPWAVNAAGDALEEINVTVYGRFNSESDFEGNYLGEVEIRMDEYTFKPSATTIGVSWSQLTEINKCLAA